MDANLVQPGGAFVENLGEADIADLPVMLRVPAHKSLANDR